MTFAARRPWASVAGSAAGYALDGFDFLILSFIMPAWCTNALGILILCSVQNFCYYGVMIWLPNDLATHFGYTLTRTGLWTAMTVLGMAAGMVAFGQVADRIGRRTAFRIWMLGAATMAIVYSLMTTPRARSWGSSSMA
ncbi:MFS transporter [Gluconacetobacter asukensis]|uniref:MFS transporter n=1 Tax=Gluconacetobacter asukensis TaxID=1017181 RepID=UPI001FE2D1DD|nr:MFS transporter [Gluconacetobacter asukensis]